MVTKEQALVARDFHYTGKHECSKTVGPRGGVTVKVTNVRASGKCKTWVRSPERFHLPVKYGLYESYWIDETNCGDFHLASECPLNSESDIPNYDENDENWKATHPKGDFSVY